MALDSRTQQSCVDAIYDKLTAVGISIDTNLEDEAELTPTAVMVKSIVEEITKMIVNDAEVLVKLQSPATAGPPGSPTVINPMSEGSGKMMGVK